MFPKEFPREFLNLDATHYDNDLGLPSIFNCDKDMYFPQISGEFYCGSSASLYNSRNMGK